MVDLKAGAATATVLTTDLIHRLRPRELGVQHMSNPPPPLCPRRLPGSTRSSAKAAALVEALPWLARFHGRTIVIKYGGHAMAEPPLREAFAEDIVFLRYAGLRVVIVHGGGPQITSHLDRLGVETEFRGGLRVTTPETMDVVRMVLVGQVNRDVVGLINAHGPFAVGMSGEDARLLTAERRGALVDGELVDIGQVGDVIQVRPDTVNALLDAGHIPVIAGVARGEDEDHRTVYNINADTAAAALAMAVEAEKLVILTDVEGLYANWPETDEVISEVKADELEAMMPGPGERHGSEDGGLPARRARGGAAGPRPRRASRPRLAPRDLHRLRHRNHGDAMNATATELLLSRRDDVFMATYARPPLALVRGEGSTVYDADGRAYLDLIAGIAVCLLGHAHPQVVEAVTGQLSTLGHTSNLYATEPAVALAEKLLGLLGPAAKVAVSSSATPARKPTRRPSRSPAVPGGTEIIAAEGSFHGRTLGALSITGQPAKRAPFEPLLPGVRFVPYGDAEALRVGRQQRDLRRLSRADAR